MPWDFKAVENGKFLVLGVFSGEICPLLIKRKLSP